MNLGFLISMYDEIDTVKQTVSILKQNKCKIILIQSDPGDSSKILDNLQIDYYKKLSDVAGSKEEYLEERNLNNLEGSTTPVKAITRNLSIGFSASQNLTVDWWIVILGDILISNLSGIQKIIKKMIIQNKSIAVTRAIGQTFMDDDNHPTKIQYKDTTDFMPQFFIVKSNLITEGLFSNFKITNRFTTEQCLGDEVNRFCSQQNSNFNDVVFIISDYAYPKYISGLKYNPDRVNMPKYIDGFVNFMRKIKTGKKK